MVVAVRENQGDEDQNKFEGVTAIEKQSCVVVVVVCRCACRSLLQQIVCNPIVPVTPAVVCSCYNRSSYHS